jgi:hypothetical protein
MHPSVGGWGTILQRILYGPWRSCVISEILHSLRSPNSLAWTSAPSNVNPMALRRQTTLYEFIRRSTVACTPFEGNFQFRTWYRGCRGASPNILNHRAYPNRNFLLLTCRTSPDNRCANQCSRFVIDEKHVKAEERYDGIWVLCPNTDVLDRPRRHVTTFRAARGLGLVPTCRVAAVIRTATASAVPLLCSVPVTVTSESDNSPSATRC